MAKVSIPSFRTAGAFSEPRPITSNGGLVQRGGYMQQRAIDIKSRPRMAPRIPKVGA